MRINHNLTGVDQSAPVLKPKIMIATPTYDRRVDSGYSMSLALTILDLYKHGIECEIRHARHMAHAPARNKLTDIFLKSDCTHILFIDEDQEWDYTKIIKMVEMDQLFIAGAFRFKKDDEEYPLVLDTERDGSLKYGPYGLVKIHQIGVALALIKRECFEIVKKANDLNRIVDYGDEYFNFHVNLFHYQGEDNDFCQKCRQANVPIYLYANMNTTHVGPKEFKANFNIFLRKFPGGDLWDLEYKKKMDEIISDSVPKGLRVKV